MAIVSGTNNAKKLLADKPADTGMQLNGGDSVSIKQSGSSSTNTGGFDASQYQNLLGQAKQNASTAQYQSPATAQAKQVADSYGSNPYGTFKESNKTKGAYQYLQDTLKNKPEDYKSKWGSTIDNLIDQIVNRKDFSYDFNADPLYQQYKDQYQTLGQNAMNDTVAKVSNMTGGYGNSYAATAGNQAYQGYLQNLNDVVPQLYQMALDRYNTEGQDLYNQYNMYNDQYRQEYGQLQDRANEWQSEANRLYNVYGTESNMDYSRYGDNRDYLYNVAQDMYKNEYGFYNDEEQRRLAEYQMANAGSSGGRSGGSGGGNEFKGYKAADWEEYLGMVQQNNGLSAAQAELKRLRESGILPEEFYSAAAIGATSSKYANAADHAAPKYGATSSLNMNYRAARDWLNGKR